MGRDEYVPVWEELDARGAVVFVHHLSNKNGVPFNKKLFMPAFDWPHETGRTAMDLILNWCLQQFPNITFILSHAGGTLPALVKRYTLIAQSKFGAAMSAEDIIGQAKHFYFDLAVSGNSEVLPLILAFAEKGHVLFGNDYPHPTVSFSKELTRFVDEYEMDDEQRKEIYHGAAENLFPRLKGAYDA